MILVVAFLSFVFSFSILCITRFFLAGGRFGVGDTFFHLLISQSIREHQWKHPSSLQNVTFIEGDKNYDYLAYPPLIHYIIALFPSKFHQKTTIIFNLVILSFVSSLATIFAYNITSNLAVLIFSSITVVFNLSVFEGIVSFTPRPLGVLFYSLVVYIAILYPQNLLSVLALTVLVTLISLTHKFALQAVIFGLLPYALIFDRSYLLLSIVFGLLLSILASKGFYIKILKDHIIWLQVYSSYPHHFHIVYKLKRIFSRNFWCLATLMSMALLFIHNNEDFLYTDLFAKLTYWSFITIAIALIVSIPLLSFLGEEYRYIDYSVFPVGIAYSLLIANSNIDAWFVTFAFIMLTFLSLFKIKKYLHQSKLIVEPDDIMAYRSLRDNLGNLLVFPHIRTLEISYFTSLQVVHPVRPRPRFNSDSELLDNVINTYRIQYVLKFKGTGPDKLFAALTDMTGIEKIQDFKNVELYKLILKN
jgi:hypothetical protein